MQTKAALVLERFESGDCVVNSSGRHFWVNNENLSRAVSADEMHDLEAVSADEMQGLEELIRMKIITKWVRYSWIKNPPLPECRASYSELKLREMGSDHGEERLVIDRDDGSGADCYYREANLQSAGQARVDTLLQAFEIVQRLAEWSAKYPRQKVHSFSAKVDEQLIEIEDAAKAWLDRQNLQA